MTNLPIEYWHTESRTAQESPMQRLFNRFDGMYPGMFHKNFKDSTSVENWKDAWAECFFEERISPQEIVIGLRICRKTLKYPPSLMEFLECCRPPIDYGKAFYEAVDQMGIRKNPSVKLVNGEVKHVFGQDTWSNPAIFWAAKAMGSALFSRYIEVKSHWAYELDKVLSGEVKPVPQNALMIDPPQNVSKELTAQELDNVDKVLKKVYSLFDEGKGSEEK